MRFYALVSWVRLSESREREREGERSFCRAFSVVVILRTRSERNPERLRAIVVRPTSDSESRYSVTS